LTVANKNKETYYEVWDDSPGSWLLGKLVVNQRQLDEILQKARAKGQKVSYRRKD